VTGNGPRKVRTIADLAKLAGVSTGTVSRALAGKSLVNAVTRDRIQAMAREHGFRPNQMASKLRTQRTGVIGVVFTLGHEREQPISDPFFMMMLSHLADGLTGRGYDLMLSRVLPDSDEWLDNLASSGMVDGLMMIGQSNQTPVIERVAEWYRPMVAWGQVHPAYRHCAVGSDNRLGGQLAARRLVDRGCRRLLFLGDIEPPEIAERFAGANAEAQRRGLPPVDTQLVRFASQAAEQDLARIIDSIIGTYDGILCASDVIAMVTLRALADHDVAVPDRIAVMGFDDITLAAQAVPRLSTIHQDVAAGAQAMIDALFARMNGDDAPSVVLQTRLVARDSA